MSKSPTKDSLLMPMPFECMLLNSKFSQQIVVLCMDWKENTICFRHDQSSLVLIFNFHITYNSLEQKFTLFGMQCFQTEYYQNYLAIRRLQLVECLSCTSCDSISDTSKSVRSHRFYRHSWHVRGGINELGRPIMQCGIIKTLFSLQILQQRSTYVMSLFPSFSFLFLFCCCC